MSAYTLRLLPRLLASGAVDTSPAEYTRRRSPARRNCIGHPEKLPTISPSSVSATTPTQPSGLRRNFHFQSSSGHSAPYAREKRARIRGPSSTVAARTRYGVTPPSPTGTSRAAPRRRRETFGSKRPPEATRG